MKISKYLHSCLLVEDQKKTFLFDPGVFTFQEKVLAVNSLSKLDYILITHEHPDHVYLPFVHDLVTKFPDVKIVTNQSIVNILHNENIKATDVGDNIVQLENAPHEMLWDSKPPENTLITLSGRLAHPGDSLHFKTSVEILALPIVAPWGSTTDAVNLALKLKPKVVIPIHDWMYKDIVRQMMYQRFNDFFKSKGITFKGLETGEQYDF